MASQRTHTRPLFLIVLTTVLIMTAVVGSIQAQEGLIPLPSLTSRGFSELQVLEPSTGYSSYGYSVAADGNLLAFGAQQGEGEEQLEQVLVYRRNSSGVWVYEATLVVAEDYMEGGESFGASIAVSGDTIVVGATCDRVQDGGENECQGAAYFYERNSGGTWQQVAKFTGHEEFGQHVTIDGDLAAVSEESRIGGEGKAYAFKRTSGVWVPDGVYWAGIGLTLIYDVVINGERLVLSGLDYPSSTQDWDNLVVHERNSTGWVSPASMYIIPADDSNYGLIELVGDTLFAFNWDANPDKYGILVYHENGGQWVNQQTVPLDMRGRPFYFRIFLASDGNLLAAGEVDTRVQSLDGVVHLFSWNGSEWVPQQKIIGDRPGFGESVAVENGILFVGSPVTYQEGAAQAGHVYIYAIDDTPTTPEPTSEPTQDPTSDPTAEPTQEPTSDPTDEPTPVPPTSTPESTPDPTSDPTDEADTQVLGDGGFEQLTGWTLKNASGDKLKCNTVSKTVSHEGLCAFLFKGKPGENAKLQQTIVPTITSGVNPGGTLTLSGYVNASGAVDSKVKVVVKYADGVTPKSKITVNIGAETGGVYVPLSSFQPVLTTSITAPVDKIKVTVKNKGESGKVYYDALSLTAQ